MPVRLAIIKSQLTSTKLSYIDSFNWIADTFCLQDVGTVNHRAMLARVLLKKATIFIQMRATKYFKQFVYDLRKFIIRDSHETHNKRQRQEFSTS